MTGDSPKARPWLSFGFFGFFGRAHALKAFDRALRDVDLHPRLVTDALKLTAVRLLSDEAGPSPTPADYARAAEIVAYCVLGAGAFAAVNPPERLAAVEARIGAAVEAGTGLDAELVLLTHHAGVLQPDVRAHFAIEVE